MSWSEINSDNKPSEKQISKAEELMEKVYGDIVRPIYSMTKQELSKLIDELNEKLNEGTEFAPYNPEYFRNRYASGTNQTDGTRTNNIIADENVSIGSVETLRRANRTGRITVQPVEDYSDEPIIIPNNYNAIENLMNNSHRHHIEHSLTMGNNLTDFNGATYFSPGEVESLNQQQLQELTEAVRRNIVDSPMPFPPITTVNADANNSLTAEDIIRTRDMLQRVAQNRRPPRITMHDEMEECSTNITLIATGIARRINEETENNVLDTVDVYFTECRFPHVSFTARIRAVTQRGLTYGYDRDISDELFNEASNETFLEIGRVMVEELLSNLRGGNNAPADNT